MKTKGKPQAAKSSPSEHDVLGRVLESVRDYLKKKDYELYREAMNEWENVAASPPAVNAHAGMVEMFRALIRVEAGMGTAHKLTAKEVADHARAALRAAGEAV